MLYDNFTVQNMAVFDAFKQENNCPLCELRAKAESSYIKGIFVDNIRSDAFKLKLLDTRFCEKHLKTFLNYSDKLGVSMLFRYLTDFIIEDIENVNTSGKKFLISKTSPNTQFIQSVEKKSCMICDYLSEKDKENVEEIFKLYTTSEEFRSLYLGCHGFCFNHLIEIIKFTDDKPNKVTNEFLSKTMELEKKKLQNLKKDISDFINSFDYRNINMEITDAQKNSIKNACQLIGGLHIDGDEYSNRLR